MIKFTTETKRNNNGMVWDEERDTILRRLASEGLSGTKIGAEMGISKGAVIGRANRIGVKVGKPRSRAGVPNSTPRPRRPKSSLRNFVVPQARRSAIPQIEIDPLVQKLIAESTTSAGSLVDALLRLRHCQCRYPLLNNEFCEKDAIIGSSYCAEHLQLTTRDESTVATVALRHSG
jgi:GcrA cell cycle regulator